MSSIKDNKGYNQGYRPSRTMSIRTKRRSDYILGRMNQNRENEILEIGCGLGDISFLLAQYPNNIVLGADLCETFIKRASKKYEMKNLQFILLDFNYPEVLKDKKFDYIIGNGILHHLYYDLDKALTNLKKLLKSEGKIIFLEPNLLNPYCYLIFNTIPLFRRMANLEPTEKAFTKKYINNNKRYFR